MTELDPRLNAFRPDLADLRLEGQVKAERFVKGKQRRVIIPVADLRKTPHFDSAVQTQLLMGEDVLVFESDSGFSWVQSLKDGYVGYVNADALENNGKQALTHYVSVPRTFLYPGPDLRLAQACPISLGTRLTITGEAETRGTRYGLLENGSAVIFNHLAPIEIVADDYVTVAEKLVYTPYLWGGISGFGIDCSGLVQLSMAIAGNHVLRDSDMQASTIGQALDSSAALQRGDLVFWPGHVAIMKDRETIIHANGASMDVRIEPLVHAIERIASFYGRPNSYRRP